MRNHSRMTLFCLRSSGCAPSRGSLQLLGAACADAHVITGSSAAAAALRLGNVARCFPVYTPRSNAIVPSSAMLTARSPNAFATRALRAAVLTALLAGAPALLTANAAADSTAAALLVKVACIVHFSVSRVSAILPSLLGARPLAAPCHSCSASDSSTGAGNTHPVFGGFHRCPFRHRQTCFRAPFARHYSKTSGVVMIARRRQNPMAPLAFL